MSRLFVPVVVVIVLVVSLSSMPMRWHNPIMPVQAQDISVHCGDSIEGEFAEPKQQSIYAIEVSPGDILRISGKALGEVMTFTILILDPSDLVVAVSHTENAPTVDSGVLAARGSYSIMVSNTQWIGGIIGSTLNPYTLAGNTGLGVFALHIGCVLHDGTVIEPEEGAFEGNQPAEPVAFSGFGFPGLDPVDFSTGIMIPFTFGAPNIGSITPGFEGVFGSTFSANAGDMLDLSFIKTSGNLNLGLTLLYDESTIVFQASLVTSESLQTRLALPESGQYTIGVYRIDLLPPGSPETTSFEIQGTLNP